MHRMTSRSRVIVKVAVEPNTAGAGLAAGIRDPSGTRIVSVKAPDNPSTRSA
jgi:hypothetical protein